MEQEEKTKRDLEIEKNINAAERKIKSFFKKMDLNKKKMLEPPIRQLAMMQVTLERLSEEINTGDIIEDFVQGAQKFRRENPALKAYNATIKNYTALYKQLVDLLPNDDAEKAGQALMNFATQQPQQPQQRKK